MFTNYKNKIKMNRIFILNNGTGGAWYAILYSDSEDYRKLHLRYFCTWLGSYLPEEIIQSCNETQNLERQARKYINTINKRDNSNFVLWSY